MHGKSFPILPKSSSIKASVHCYCARRKQNTEVHKKDIMTSAFRLSHLADDFIQSDLHMCDSQCIHILHFTFTLMAHCTSGAIRGSVSCSRTLRQGIELATFCLLNDLSPYCTTAAPR